MFSKTNEKRPEPVREQAPSRRPEPPARSSKGAKPSMPSIVSEGLHVTGNLISDGDVAYGTVIATAHEIGVRSYSSYAGG